MAHSQFKLIIDINEGGKYCTFNLWINKDTTKYMLRLWMFGKAIIYFHRLHQTEL